jgi:S-(hydroxymethyl)glutathione dehydrogenase / alcohol dehydrogenase
MSTRPKIPEGGDAVPHAGKLSFAGIITHEFPLDEINAELDLVRSGAAGRVLINL